MFYSELGFGNFGERALALCLVFFGLTITAFGQPLDLSGTSDESIRNVITVVADRQLRNSATGTSLRTLVDGDYTVVYTVSAASAAARPAGIEWDYPWGVNLYGLLQAYRATGNTNYLNFVLTHNQIVGRYYSWLRSLQNSIANTTGLSSFQRGTALRELFILDRLDYCGAMTAQFMEGVLKRSDAITSEQLKIAQTTANWIAGGGQSRLPDGTLWRTNASPNYTIWGDDLCMSCPFLIRWYQYTGDARYLDDAAMQITNMAGYLQDSDGVWFHGYFYNTSSVNGYKWGRANGWAMVATVETLSVMPTNHPAYSNLLTILRRHIEGVKPLQADSGLWHQVLDHAELWEETSCSAMFTYCIARAVNRGWIDPTNMAVARKGFAGVCLNITSNGVVNGTCQGTGIGTTLSFYNNRSRPSDDMHGRGAVLLAGSEILLQPKLNVASAEGGAMVSWHADIPDSTLQSSTNLTDWSVATNAQTVAADWRNVVTASGDGTEFYRLNIGLPDYPLTPLEFEAESLDWTNFGATAEISALDTNASGGMYVMFNSDGVGDYIEFSVTNVPSGTYRLKLNFKTDTNRARVALSVDGNPIGSELDEYFYATQYSLMDFGPITFAAPGDHTIRLTVASKHGASAGYTITADRFILAPQ